MDIKKRKFYVKEVLYLRIIISRYRIKINPAKVAAIKDWARPKNVKNVQSFLGFVNFYH